MFFFWSLDHLLKGLSIIYFCYQIKGPKEETEVLGKLQLAFDDPKYEMSDELINENIVAMKICTRIVFKVLCDYEIIFYHEDNPDYEKSGLYEIMIFDELKVHHLKILKNIGANCVKIKVLQKDSGMTAVWQILKCKFTRNIIFDIPEVTLLLSHSIRQLRLSYLELTVEKMDFYTLKSLLLTECESFDFKILNLWNMPKKDEKIAIWPGCAQIKIRVKSLKYARECRRHPELLVFLLMSPEREHRYYNFDLPKNFKLHFYRDTICRSVVLHEKDFYVTNFILNNFIKMDKLELYLENCDGISLLGQQPQFWTVTSLKIIIQSEITLKPVEIVSVISKFENLKNLSLNLQFSEDLNLENSDEVVIANFLNLVYLSITTNIPGFGLLELCNFNDCLTNLQLQGPIKFHSFGMEKFNFVKRLSIETITCLDDWEMLLSIKNLEILEIIKPVELHLNQNTANHTLQGLSIC
ncbi:hypothetical protein M153_14400001403, partial [Pseudoloma neurophilia]